MYTNGTSLQTQLKRLKKYRDIYSVDQTWVEKNREQLLTTIQSTVSSRQPQHPWFYRVFHFTTIFVSNKFRHVFARPVLMAVSVMVTVVGGWIAGVSASNNSLPGDTLYNFKWMAEKTHETFYKVTGNTVAETELQLEHASKRAEEAKKVADKPESAIIAIKSLKKSIESVDKNLKDINKTEPQKAVNITKDISKKSETIINTLQEVSDVQSDVGVAKAVVETSIVVNKTSLDAVESVVEKKAEGEVRVSDQEVKDLVTKQIDKALQQVEQTKANLKEGAPSTTSSSTLSTTTSQGIEEAITKAEESSLQAKDLVANNNIVEALQKVKETTAVTILTQQVLVDAKTKSVDAPAGPELIVVSSSTLPAVSSSTSPSGTQSSTTIQIPASTLSTSSASGTVKI